MTFDFCNCTKEGYSLIDLIKKDIYLVKLLKYYLGDPSRETKTNLYYLCPFHKEYTASFCVNKARNLFYCFGCGAGGNVIDFIIKLENFADSNYKQACIYIMMLLNYFPESQNQNDKNLFESYSIKFNFAYLISFHFFSSKSSPVFLSKDKLNCIVDTLTKLGFSNRAIKKLHIKRIENKYVLVIANNLFVNDFISYDTFTGRCYSVLYKQYTQKELNNFCKKIKSGI